MKRCSGNGDGFARGSVPDQYAGGLGSEGIRALDVFVKDGGTLVAMNQSSDLVIDELHLPVRNVVRGLSRQEFFSTGSLLEAQADVIATGNPGCIMQIRAHLRDLDSTAAVVHPVELLLPARRLHRDTPT